jgi:hypothetical protein
MADDLNPSRAQDGARSGPRAATGRLIDRLAFLAVLVAAIIAAGMMYANYYGAPDLLWREFYSDRNSHYSFGLDLALAARHLDPVWFFSELEKAKVWPPFHGLALSVVLLLGGIDYRLGVLPSLIGWTVTIAFVWLIARRLFTDRTAGLMAAAIAATLTAASPTFQVISTDVMLEGIGAGLSAAGLWAYLRAFEAPEQRWRWRLLALILIALFFHKGNYWGLLVAPLALAYASERRRAAVATARSIWASVDRRAVLKATLGSPLLILALLLAAAVGWLYARGPTALMLFGRPVSLYPPENLTTVAYALVFIWWSLLWVRNRAAIERVLGVPGRAMLYWHLSPIAISFLLPHRLSRFLWFVGPANNADPNYSLSGGVRYYWTVFADGFHTEPALALPVAILALIGALGIRRLTPGARAVFLFALLAFIGVVVHPQHQGRFMSTWVFAVWICAGAGGGLLLASVRDRMSSWVRALLATSVALALLVVNIGRPTPAIAYAYAIQPRFGPSDLELVRPYLHELEGTHEVTVVTTFGTSKLFAWMIREHCRCHRIVNDPFIDSLTSREQARAVMAERVAQSTADVIVTIDAPQIRYALPAVGWVYPTMVGVIDAMAAQDRYQPGNSYPLRSGEATATIWRLR